MGYIFAILFGVILLLTALVGNIGPFIAAAGALVTFALCMAWLSSLGSVDMGVAFFIIAILIIVPVVAFFIVFRVLYVNGKKPMALSGVARGIFLLVGGLVLAASAYVNDIKENADLRIEAAIRDNKPPVIAKEKKRNGAWANAERVEDIMGRYGITEDSLALLRSFRCVDNNVWGNVLERPASPERLHFLRELATMCVYSVDAKYFIRLMDEGEVESADAIYPFVSYPDSAMVSAGRPDLLRDVIRRGVPDKYYARDDFPALVVAARKDPEYTRILLDAGYDPNHADSSGRTALHIATMHGHTQALQLLLAAGAHIDHADGSGRTALHIATMPGHTEALQLLLDKGANVSAQTEPGMMPLHHAALFGNEGACLLLLAAGAPVNAADAKGRTPLGIAVSMGGGPVVAALVENASPATKALAGIANEQGKTPWYLALEYPRPRGDQYKRLVNAKFGLSATGFLAKNGDEEIAVPAADVWLASLNAKAAMVRHLLAAGAEPTRMLAKGNTLFHSAFEPQPEEDCSEVVHPHWGRYWRDAHENKLRRAYWEILPTVYPQALESLLRAGIPLPALEEGMTYEDYCRAGPNDYEKNLYAECAAVLEAERARREAARE